VAGGRVAAPGEPDALDERDVPGNPADAPGADDPPDGVPRSGPQAVTIKATANTTVRAARV
jgi:hypothetical protein